MVPARGGQALCRHLIWMTRRLSSVVADSFHQLKLGSTRATVSPAAGRKVGAVTLGSSRAAVSSVNLIGRTTARWPRAKRGTAILKNTGKWYAAMSRRLYSTVSSFHWAFSCISELGRYETRHVMDTLVRNNSVSE